MIWLNQQNFGWFNHRIYLLYGFVVLFTTKSLVVPTKHFVRFQPNYLVVLIKSEYLLDSTKKYISINQNLFD